MSVKHLFSCDLCRSDIYANDKPPGIGLRWEFQRIKPGRLDESEHHLCDVCVHQLEDTFVEIRKKRHDP